MKRVYFLIKIPCHNLEYRRYDRLNNIFRLITNKTKTIFVKVLPRKMSKTIIIRPFLI